MIWFKGSVLYAASTIAWSTLISGSRFQDRCTLIISSRESVGSNTGRVGLPPEESHHHCTQFKMSAPPRYMLPISLYGPTCPIPAPDAHGTAAANPGGWKALSLCCSSALDEQPSAPTFPLDQGCFVIQPIVSYPSSPERTRYV